MYKVTILCILHSATTIRTESQILTKYNTKGGQVNILWVNLSTQSLHTTGEMHNSLRTNVNETVNHKELAGSLEYKRLTELTCLFYTAC